MAFRLVLKLKLTAVSVSVFKQLQANMMHLCALMSTILAAAIVSGMEMEGNGTMDRGGES